MKRWMKKLKDNGGESLAETLVALLIASMALTMIPGAILAAARVNKSVEEAYVYSDQSKGTSQTAVFNLKLKDSSGTESAAINTKGSKDTYGDKTYYYYRIYK